jgi:hypothetical protein
VMASSGICIYRVVGVVVFIEERERLEWLRFFERDSMEKGGRTAELYLKLRL